VARRKGFMAIAVQAQRDIERRQREQARAQAAAVRAREQATRAAARAAAADAKEQAALYAAARNDEVEARNAELEARMDDLRDVLAATLRVDDYVDLEQLKESLQVPPFEAGNLAFPALPPDPAKFAPPPLSTAQRLVPGAKGKHEQAVLEGRHRYEHAHAAWQADEARRQQQLAQRRAAYDQAVETERHRVAKQHAEIDEFNRGLNAGDQQAIVNYAGMVLDGSVWPDGFPQEFSLAYDASSRLLGVDYVLPGLDAIPKVKTHKYVKTKAEIAVTAMPEAARRALYSDLMAKSALRVLHELFEADRRQAFDTVALNCFVATINPATGQPARPCVLSVRTTRELFTPIKLDKVDPHACLKGLAAAVSASPAELAPVRPVLELKMVDPRFIEEQDVLSMLDQRPNLMELSPGEFESLITNLFMEMGLESRQTQPSRDGGVDCVGYDPRPIFGGKVVIQAKRYKNTVGVSAVRDLYGTMQNEGASKGILVTTSGYGKASFDFANGKPLELLSGANLLFLLEEHVGLRAKIVMPDGSQDPAYDTPADPTIRRSLPPPPPPAPPGTSAQTNPFPSPRSVPS